MAEHRSFIEHRVTEHNTFIADADTGTCDQLLYLILCLAAKGTVQGAGPVIIFSIRHSTFLREIAMDVCVHVLLALAHNLINQSVFDRLLR